MFGEDYIWQYITNRAIHDNEIHLYRMYITDSLKAISENKSLVHRYVEIRDSVFNSENYTNSEEKADEIKQNIITKLGG